MHRPGEARAIRSAARRKNAAHFSYPGIVELVVGKARPHHAPLEIVEIPEPDVIAIWNASSRFVNPEKYSRFTGASRTSCRSILRPGGLSKRFALWRDTGQPSPHLHKPSSHRQPDPRSVSWQLSVMGTTFSPRHNSGVLLAMSGNYWGICRFNMALLLCT